MCEHYPDEAAVDYRRGLLPGDEAEEFRQHLELCTACRDAVREAEFLLESLSPRDLLPSANAEARIREIMHQEARKLSRSQPSTRRPVISFKYRWCWAAATVAILVIAMVLVRPWTTAVAARLAEVDGEVMLRHQGSSQKAVAGMPLYRDDTLVAADDGGAIVVLADTTRLEIGPRTTLALGEDRGEGPRNLRLESGVVTVRAARRRADRPLCIATPGARTEVVGTKFTLAAARRHTNVRVEEGRVRLVRSRDGEAIDVVAGHRLSVADQGRLVPAPTRSGTVLIIVSRQQAGEKWERFNQLMGTRLVSDRLRQLCLAVEVKDHHDVQPQDLENRPFVIVSHAEVGTGLGKSLRRIHLEEAAVPVICLEAIALPTLKMSGREVGSDFRWDEPALPLTLRDSAHPLAAELCATSLAQVPCYGWAVPSADATVITGIARDPKKATTFCYDAGTAMAGMTAPARRVGLLLDPDQMTEDREAAWLLFEAAIQWCADPAAVWKK